VQGVLSTELAELFILDFFRLLLFVASCCVVPLFAFRALECDYISHLYTVALFIFKLKKILG
jgi:hypothetical protein